MFRALAFGVVALLPLPLVLAQNGDEKTPAGKILKVRGKLTDDDPKDKVLQRSPHRVHTCKMTKDTIYVIDLVSDEFDAFLRLENPDGKQVATDDDSGGGLNARIVHKATLSGDYRIIATSLDGKTGAYRLSVRTGTKEDVAKADPFHDLMNKPAPDVVGAFSFNGKTKKLSDLKGKVVLLDFWAVWCGPCIATFPHLREWAKDYKKDGLEILGVTTYYERFGFDKENGRLKRLDDKAGKDDEHAMLKEFAAHHKLKHRLMVVSKDAWAEAGKAYHVRGIPTVVVIDREGIVRMVRVGSGPANAEALHEEIKKLLSQK